MALLNELYQEIIIDHSAFPRNEGTLDAGTHFAEAYNATCGDELTLTLLVANNFIKDVKFHGQGCSISKASASMMTEKIKNMTVTKALEFSKNLQKILNGDDLNPLDEEMMGDLIALLGVRQFPMRVKCATLPWHALDDALQCLILP
ncbi:MAG: SUF system NifU family Fe-S cluster assembly protein [Puniceicoccales bacterium]|nr:SUF system NifU family Fe-S cluster assembly protein [Puniceicoccales bacterium]